MKDVHEIYESENDLAITPTKIFLELGFTSHYRWRNKKKAESFLLSFHEFLSVRAHIDRVSRWHIEVLLGTQKFRI